MVISVPSRAPGLLRSVLARAVPSSTPPSLRRLRVAVAVLFGILFTQVELGERVWAVVEEFQALRTPNAD